MFGHHDGVAAVGRRLDGAIHGRSADTLGAGGRPDHQLAGAAIVEERFVGRAAEQVLIGADRFLLAQDFLDDVRLGDFLVRRYGVIVGDGLEQDALIVEEEERRAEDRIDPRGNHALGHRRFLRDIHPPEFDPERE